MTYRELAMIILSSPGEQQQQTVTALVEGETIPLNFAHETVVDDVLDAGHIVLSPDEIPNMRAVAADPVEVTTTTSFHFRLYVQPHPPARVGMQACRLDFNSEKAALSFLEKAPELFARKFGSVMLFQESGLTIRKFVESVDTGII
jgi:hypothetical protein